MHRPASEASGTRRMLRGLSAAVLPCSLMACLMADRPSMAVLVWVMLLTGSTVMVALLGVLALPIKQSPLSRTHKGAVGGVTSSG